MKNVSTTFTTSDQLIFRLWITQPQIKTNQDNTQQKTTKLAKSKSRHFESPCHQKIPLDIMYDDIIYVALLLASILWGKVTRSVPETRARKWTSSVFGLGNLNIHIFDKFDYLWLFMLFFSSHRSARQWMEYISPFIFRSLTYLPHQIITAEIRPLD